MDWQTLAMAWGPAIPILCVLLKAHWDLVYKTMPNGFKRLHEDIEHQCADSERRHEEHMRLQRKLLRAIQVGACRSANKKPRVRRRRAD